MRQSWLCIAIIIILSLNACNASNIDAPIKPATDQPSVSIIRTQTGTSIIPLPTLQPTLLPTATAVNKPSATPLPIPTSSIEATDTQLCLYASKFIEDVTIPDGSLLPTGQQVEKTWRIRNTGTCSWKEGTSLIHIEAHKFDAPGKVTVPLAIPGDEVDVSISFTTPKTPGIYESYWRLENAKGELFGGVLFIRLNTSTSIKIAEPTLPTPTLESTKTPTATPTKTPIPTATPTSIATRTPTATPIFGCGEFNPQFMGVLAQASMLGLDVGCALGTASYSTGTVQEFWINIDSQDAHQRFRSLLLKNDDTGTVYVLVGKDTLTYEATVAVFDENTYNVSDGDYTCDAPTPPDGYISPQNNFAKVWCDKQYWEVVGWPRQREATADLVIQTTERGILARVSALPNTVYYLALDLDTEQGTVQMGP